MSIHNKKRSALKKYKYMVFLGGCILAVLITYLSVLYYNKQILLNSTYENVIPQRVQALPAKESEILSESTYTRIDPLLVLVNHENSLPENYEVVPQLYDNIIVDIKCYPHLIQLLNDARKENIILWIASGYRSVEEQASILERGITEREKNGMTYEEAKEDALKTISVPRYSEHHTGLAVDFNTVSHDFADTEEYKWLQKNAEEYGFVQRYRADKEDITKISEEVWHYRYVGIEHAKKMNALDLCLEEYLKYLYS